MVVAYSTTSDLAYMSRNVYGAIAYSGTMLWRETMRLTMYLWLIVMSLWVIIIIDRTER